MLQEPQNADQRKEKKKISNSKLHSSNAKEIRLLKIDYRCAGDVDSMLLFGLRLDPNAWALLAPSFRVNLA